MISSNSLPTYKTVKELSPRALFKPLASGSSEYMVIDKNHEIIPEADRKWRYRVWAVSLKDGSLRDFWPHHRVQVIHFYPLVGDEKSDNPKDVWNSRKHD